MIDQMGKVQGEAFLQYLHRPDESHLQNAAQVLLIWQIVIVDGSEPNLLQWHRWLQKARLAAPITDAQVRLALGFLREMEPDMQELNAFQMRYNAFFPARRWCALVALIVMPDGVTVLRSTKRVAIWQWLITSERPGHVFARC
ncbi:probable membrane protein YPO2654 [Citrobacter freundii]|uniref:Probable membrane protein YPO2654 n=1 Tax=Citrobacter freundii TaxID=546 RepID=A0A7G2IW12_CITFR|nr:probable membrane protein YPO2654 [Citrobacter freundii]